MPQPFRFTVWLPLCLLLIVGYFTFFHQLGKHPMYMWDEASYGLNAQEMLETGNPIEVQLLGAADLYNTKPPFAIWCMAGCVKVLGFNEVGVRMASALFALFSSLVLFGVGLKIFKNGWSALPLPLVLMSSNGFVGEHISRTGDTDSILAFWILVQAVCIWSYTRATPSKQSNLYLIGTAVALSLGCLTKGVAGLMALPGIIGWLLYSRQFKSIFSYPGFYVGLVVFVILVPGYYGLRSHLTPGYWDAVWNFEVGGRLVQQEFLNPKSLPFYYFYQMMFADQRLLLWICILPLSIVLICWSKPGNEKNAGLAFVWILLGVSFSLALSQTKLFWYDAPLYPLIAAVIGISFGLLIQGLSSKYVWVFGCFCIWPLYEVVLRNHESKGGTHLNTCLYQLRNSEHQHDTIHVINADPNFVVHFYTQQDVLRGHVSDVVFPENPSLHKGSYILTEKYAREVDMNTMYVLDTLFRYEECSYYRIIDKK